MPFNIVLHWKPEPLYCFSKLPLGLGLSPQSLLYNCSLITSLLPPPLLLRESNNKMAMWDFSHSLPGTSIFFCMCAAGSRVHMCTCMSGQRLIPCVFLNCVFYCLMRWNLSLKLEFTNQDRPTGQHILSHLNKPQLAQLSKLHTDSSRIPALP